MRPDHMLWMPSWGGMINGLMTLSGAWDKLRTDPGLRFSVTAVGFYGMSTFEGPVMSIRDVNALSHYTDWTIGHVHSGALGWVAFISFGAFYYLVPILWKRSALYSTRLASWHYWIATLGIVFYISAMWVAGIMQGLMWRAYDQFGFLQYSFAESVVAVHPYYVIRMIGGLMFLTGALIMVREAHQGIARLWRLKAEGRPDHCKGKHRRPLQGRWLYRWRHVCQSQGIYKTGHGADSKILL